MTIAQAIHQAGERLAEAGVSNARLDAELLFCFAAKKDRAWLLSHFKDHAEQDIIIVFDGLVARRIQREPVQYITGMQEFWGMEFIVTPDVLIPRPETELIVEACISGVRHNTAPLIIDLCTGSGCIAVSLAKEMPAARIFATDASGRALTIARKNTARHGVSGRIRFFEGDLFWPLSELAIRGAVDIIAVNPPYISSADAAELQPEVRDYEPKEALVAGPEGTEIQKRIIESAPEFLKSGGVLVMEMGINQADALKEMIHRSAVFKDLAVLKDLAGIERVIMARRL